MICVSLFRQVHENIDRVIRNLAKRDLRELPPLDIATKSQSPGNYKEVWQPKNCYDSTRLNAMSEAGASMYWLDPIQSLGGFEGDPILNEDISLQLFACACMSRQ